MYGKDLIFHAVRQPEVIDSSLQMTKEVLINDSRSIKAELELCKWFVRDPVVFQLTRDFMQKVSLRNDVFDIMTW